MGRLVSFVGDFFSLNSSLARYRFEKKSPTNFISHDRNNNVTVFSPFTSHFSLTQPPAFTLAEVLITLGIIGIVAAMTLPSLVGKYQKKVTVERLKKVYTVLSQAVLMSVKDHEAIEYWNFELSSQEFMDTYLKPYFQNIASEITSSDTAKNSKKYALADGTTFSGWMFKNPNPANHDITTFYRLEVDINGEQKPNLAGRDIFYYYIFPIKSNFFNGGQGNIAYKVPGPGLYPDGYGYDRERLKTDGWRGCDKRPGDETPDGGVNNEQAGAFCTALIMLDGWEIADDYRW
ncbi:type II secretion system protein [bacterium]|nr:type II secretion system protein [bacterium]